MHPDLRGVGPVFAMEEAEASAWASHTLSCRFESLRAKHARQALHCLGRTVAGRMPIAYTAARRTPLDCHRGNRSICKQFAQIARTGLSSRLLGGGGGVYRCANAQPPPSWIARWWILCPWNQPMTLKANVQRRALIQRERGRRG